MNVIELARFSLGPKNYESLIKQVRNAALEDAAKVCDELAELNRKAMTDSMWQQEECAAAIRTRKEAA
ncbi:hypothetical protein CHU94_08170 [Rhodoferax sp. TH121]|uniref:hypothetical protein n=1 Tax=Rhodoferax sp. TH121 TaxID=2022803 RepID=UPI000B9759EF|nr:hypothetical protein [Rhodoferax sp. TH121]OYQ41076.1 hypothetical protein CHU94_08170 [Rhodoferax sp. TH121]